MGEQEKVKVKAGRPSNVELLTRERKSSTSSMGSIEEMFKKKRGRDKEDYDEGEESDGSSVFNRSKKTARSPTKSGMDGRKKGNKEEDKNKWGKEMMELMEKKLRRIMEDERKELKGIVDELKGIREDWKKEKELMRKEIEYIKERGKREKEENRKMLSDIENRVRTKKKIIGEKRKEGKGKGNKMKKKKYKKEGNGEEEEETGENKEKKKKKKEEKTYNIIN